VIRGVANALGRILHADVLRKLLNRAFGGRVSDVGVGEADARGRRVVDDGTATLLEHLRDHCATRQIHTLDVDPHQTVPIFFFYLEWAADNLKAYIVEQHIDATIGLDATGDHGVDLRRVRDIAPMRGALSAFAGDDAASLLGCVEILVDRKYLGAFAREQDGRGSAIAPPFCD